MLASQKSGSLLWDCHHSFALAKNYGEVVGLFSKVEESQLITAGRQIRAIIHTTTYKSHPVIIFFYQLHHFVK
jgi:hypothetical protein